MHIEIEKYLTGSLQGNELVLVEIHRLVPKGPTVLHRLGQILRKFRLVDLPALTTALDLGSMLRYIQSHRWKVNHLPSLVITGKSISQGLPIATTATYFME